MDRLLAESTDLDPTTPDVIDRGPKAGYLLLLVPLLCCGGPFLVATIAAASAVALGVGGAIAGVILFGGATVLLVRRKHRCRDACFATSQDSTK